MPSPHHSDGERRMKLASRTECPACRARLEQPPAGQEEESWPVLTVARYDQGSRGASFDLAPVGAVVVPGDENYRAYYPESHPAVLSVKDARLLMAVGDPAAATEKQRRDFAALRDRLADYGKEHHADR